MSKESTKKVMQDTLDVYIKQSPLSELEFHLGMPKFRSVLEAAVRVLEFIDTFPDDLNEVLVARSGIIPFKQNRGKTGMPATTIVKAIKPLKPIKATAQINGNYEEPTKTLSMRDRLLLLLQQTAGGLVMPEIAKGINAQERSVGATLYTLRKEGRIKSVELPAEERTRNGPKLRHYYVESAAA